MKKKLYGKIYIYGNRIFYYSENKEKNENLLKIIHTNY